MSLELAAAILLTLIAAYMIWNWRRIAAGAKPADARTTPANAALLAGLFSFTAVAMWITYFV